MKKLIPIILLAPFLIITLNYGIDKYIHMLFNIKDETGADLTSMMLTMLTILGFVPLIANKVIK